jgi:hypothetical protein
MNMSSPAIAQTVEQSAFTAPELEQYFPWGVLGR